MSRKKTGLQLGREPYEQLTWMITDLEGPKKNEWSEGAHRNILSIPVDQYMCLWIYEYIQKTKTFFIFIHYLC